MTRCSGRRYLGYDGQFGPLQRTPQQFTSWDAVHTTLLHEFPAKRYHGGKRISGTALRADGGLTIAMDDGGEVEANILIAANGAQSSARRSLYSEIEPDYAGYFA